MTPAEQREKAQALTLQAIAEYDKLLLGAQIDPLKLGAHVGQLGTTVRTLIEAVAYLSGLEPKP